jgi:hypothetical protein
MAANGRVHDGLLEPGPSPNECEIAAGRRLILDLSLQPVVGHVVLGND